jgi:hypothetical protein
VTSRATQAALQALDALSDDELLSFHREVCRRAARVYEPRYRAVREHNYDLAMRTRDTRFRKGLTVRENIARCLPPRP